MDLEQLKYPNGKYRHPENVTPAIRHGWMASIASLPVRLEQALENLTSSQLDTPYRPEGWTVRQLVHHIADSHTNAHCRIRLALTEETPVIKPYDQNKWAHLPDIATQPVEPSLAILKGLHQRWFALLENLDEAQFQRSYFHPEDQKSYTIEWMTGLYAWHGDHHLAHITGLKARNDWK